MGSWLNINAPIIPSNNPKVYNKLGNAFILIDSEIVRKTLFNDTSPIIGPAGPRERAYANNAIPILSKAAANIPLKKRSTLNSSTYQY